MNSLGIQATEWVAHTAIAGGFVLALGWFLSRKAAPTSARIVAGWSVRGAVLAAVLCLLPGWITLPIPHWASPPSAASSASTNAESKATDSQSKSSDQSITSDVTQVNSGEWVLVNVLPEPAQTDAKWISSNQAFDPKLDGKKYAVNPADLTQTLTPFDTTGTVIKPSTSMDQSGLALSISDSLPPTTTTAVRSPSLRDVVLEISSVVLVAYGFGLAFALGQLFLGQIALSRIVIAASPAPARVRELFDEACEKAGVKARLLLSNRVSSPVCFGLFSPSVVLPKYLAQTAYDNELKWVFAHELDHLRRGDQRLAWWVGLARALYFFVPPFWAVRKQLGLAQEYLADAAAARIGNAADYAQFLVTLSSAPIDRRVSRHPLTVTGVRAGRSDLFRRVNMLVNAAPESKQSKRWTKLATIGTVGAAVLLSGFGFASNDKPKSADAKESVSEKASFTADDQADKRAAEAKAQAEQARAEARKAQLAADMAAQKADKLAAEAANSAKAARTGDNVRVVTARADAKDVEARKAEINALKKEIAEAAKKGDVEAVNKAADSMAKLATASQTRVMTVIADGQPVAPAVPGKPVPPVPPIAVWQVAPQVNEAMKAAHDHAMQQLKKAMETVKDNPEAKAEVEKAMKEFQKAMETAKKEMPQTFRQLQGMKLQEMPGKMQFQMIPGQGLATAGGGEGRFGIQIEAVPAEKVKENDLVKGVGVMVVKVVPNSAAAKAGIQSGDIMLELAGKPVPGDPEDVVKMIAKVTKDEKVNVVVLHDGKKKTIEGVKIPEAKAQNSKVLETIPGTNFQFDLQPLQMDQQRVQEQLKRLQKEIEELKKLEGLHGGKGEGKSVSMSVSVNDGNYTINADRDGVKFDIKGKTGSGPESIVIKDGDKTVKAKNIDGLPEKYRADVKVMLNGLKITKE